MEAGLVLHPLEIEMFAIPLCRWNATVFVYEFRIHIVCACTCQNVGSGVVRCVSFPFATLVACNFFVNVCSHCFVVLLFSIAKVVTIFEYPNKILLFIENLCFCSLKIAVCVPKITIGRKKLKIHIRLKITEWSKNPRARAYICAYICAYI